MLVCGRKWSSFQRPVEMLTTACAAVIVIVATPATAAEAEKIARAPRPPSTSQMACRSVAGGFPNLAYCIYLLGRNRSAPNFNNSGTKYYWALAAVMAFLWFGGIVMYGVGAKKMGELGPVLIWPVFIRSSYLRVPSGALRRVNGEALENNLYGFWVWGSWCSWLQFLFSEFPAACLEREVSLSC